MLHQHQILVELRLPIDGHSIWFRRSRFYLVILQERRKKQTFSGIGGFGERKKMKRTVMDNAIRSSVVVLGSLAFGYLSLELGYKPFLEKAEQYERSLQSSQQHQQQGLVFSLCLSLSIALLMFHFRRDRFML